MHFQNAVRSIAFRRRIQGKQALNRHSLRVESRARVIAIGEVHGAARLDEGLCHLGIKIQLSSVIGYVEVCFNTGNARLAHLKQRDLNRGGQLRIVQGSTPAGSRAQDACHSQVSLLYWLELCELDPRGVEMDLVAFALRIEHEVRFGGTRGRAHVKQRIDCVAIAFELNRELLQGLPIDFALG